MVTHPSTNLYLCCLTSNSLHSIILPLRYWYSSLEVLWKRLRSKVFSLVRPWVKVKPSVDAKFFGSKKFSDKKYLWFQHFFGPRIVLGPQFFHTQNIYKSEIFQAQYFQTQNFFRLKIFMTQHFFAPKFFRIEILSNRKFFEPKFYLDIFWTKSFGPNIYSDSKVFGIKKFFWPKIFRTQNFFWIKNFSRIRFF